MKLFKKLISWTWCAKTVDMVQSIYHYIKDYGIISDTLYSDEFKLVIKRYLNINLKKDWIGRLYGVINPMIDIDGKFSLNNTIVEIDDNNTNNDEQVKYFIYKQMTLISDLFKINKLYDYISCDIRRIDKFDNFCVIFDVTSRQYMSYSLKKWMKHTLVYGIIIGAVLFFVL